MWKDPIVSEVRDAGEELVKETGGDLHNFFSKLKLVQQGYTDRLAKKKPVKWKEHHETVKSSDPTQQPTTVD